MTRPAGAGSLPGSEVGADNFSARWVGTFDFEGGDYTLFAEPDDGVRVYDDTKLLGTTTASSAGAWTF